jgi:serine/threonine protein kinase/WD40 repeat protein
MSERSADSPPPDAIDRAAAIDDFFGGFQADLPDSVADLGSAETPLPGSLDLLLLLRQAAATGVPSPRAVPATIGRYRILGLAGYGGFSVVWEAFDPVMRRRVAVKACTPDALISPSVRRRFRREAEIASRLVHPHIVTIHEVGEENGVDFITAEFCEGGSLAAWLSRHPGCVPPGVAARIARAIAHAAAYAHGAGIIHRDIKPANVMLVPDDGHDADGSIIPPSAASDSGASAPGMSVKLGDFGLGRQHDSSLDEDPLTQLTTEGARLGTPAWMAPEQIDRSFGDVGPATDVHGIGLLFDRMLTGRQLRGGQSDVETYRQVTLDDPPAANRVERRVPADLAAVCLRCLAKRPEDRYASAAALADDLGRWIAGLPTHARPLSPAQRIARVISRRPLVSSLAAAAFVAAIIAVWTVRQHAAERAMATVREDGFRKQRAATELLQGFDAARAGNITAALAKLDSTMAFDPALATSFAGRWLERRTHGERDILLTADPLPGKQPDLHCIAVSSTGDAAAVGGADGRLWLIRGLDSNHAAVSVEAHDEINDICMSPDGRLVATAGQDGRLRWWRVDGAKGLLEPAGAAPEVAAPLYAVCFTADGSHIIYGGEDRVLRLVAITGDAPPRDGHQFALLDGFSQDIEAITVLTDTTAIVAYGPTLAIIDTADGRLLRELDRGNLDAGPSVIHGVAVSPDGSRIVAAGSDRVPRVWDLASGRIVMTLATHPDWVQSCRFTPDGQRIVTVCRDGVGRVFDAKTGAHQSRHISHHGRIWDVAFDGQGRPITVGADGTVSRWSQSHEGRMAGLRLVPFSGPAVWGIAEGDGGKLPRPLLVLAGASSGLVTLDATAEVSPLRLDVRDSRSLAYDAARGRAVFGFCPNTGHHVPLVSAFGDGDSVMTPAAAPDGYAAGDAIVTWTPDGRLVSCSAEGRIFAWTPALDGVTEVGRVPMASKKSLPTSVVAAAPTLPPRVAACGTAGLIFTLGHDGKPVGEPTPLSLPGSAVSTVAWSPDGRVVACGMHDGGVHLVDAATGSLLGSLMPHLRYVQDIAFAADGRTLFTADTEHLRISDAATFHTFDELIPGWMILAVCASADGERVAVGGMGSLGLPVNERAKLGILELDPR